MPSTVLNFGMPRDVRHVSHDTVAFSRAHRITNVGAYVGANHISCRHSHAIANAGADTWGLFGCG
jgi:hypothetical protein